ncbi:MAG: hypothetical protein EOO80_18990 [Oxalobacteraceae bacterium]|nr:MAG: hypothetical protein EOO80_18990 [Oxalobacteraceae bacterium]
MTLTQQRLIFPDEAAAIADWRGREIKTWAVDVQAGPTRRPSYRQTVYVCARTGTAAAEVAQREIYPAPPRSAQWRSRLEGPRELGCVPTPF